MDPELVRRVDVRHHSLLQDRVPLGPREATAVFCRNVLIYLDRARVASFLAELRAHMERDGVLFLGASESLWNVPDGYALVRMGSSYAYRLVDIENRNERPPVTRPLAATPVVAPRSPVAVVAPAPVPVEAETIPGASPSAVETFRRAAYLAPDDPLAHLQLGLSLDAEGDSRSSQRAFRAALAALDRCDTDEIQARLEGYGVEVLRTMITTKLSEGESCR